MRWIILIGLLVLTACNPSGCKLVDTGIYEKAECTLPDGTVLNVTTTNSDTGIRPISEDVFIIVSDVDEEHNIPVLMANCKGETKKKWYCPNTDIP